MCFVQQHNQPESLLLAILHQDHRKLYNTVLNLYALNTPSRSPKLSLLSSISVLEGGGVESNYYVVSVPDVDGQNTYGSVAVIGGKEIIRVLIKPSGKHSALVFDKKVIRVAWPYSTVAAYVFR